MIKRLFVGLVFATGLFAQATFTPGSPAVAATPGKLVATAGTGSTGIACTMTGDTFPAKNITFACSIEGVTISPFTLPVVNPLIGLTITLNVGSTTTMNSLALVFKPNAVAGVDVQASVNAGAAVTGTF